MVDLSFKRLETMKIKEILYVAGALLTLFSAAQSKVEFVKTNHDFGEIREDGGYAEFTFNFVNSGEAPVRITHVKASCGCTTPGWTVEEVAPGDTGFVKARYNPRNRPGRFRKSLRVTTTDNESNTTLYIMGMVQPKPKTPEQEFPVEAGELRFKTKSLNLGKVTTEKPLKRSFDIYNGTDSLVILDPSKLILPAHLNVSTSPQVLQSKTLGKLIIEYDPIKKDDFGFVSDNIVLDTVNNASISVLAIIEEFFPEMTAEELDNAPRLEVSMYNYKFEPVKAGQVIEKTFDLTNSGKRKLDFRTIKSNCDCLTYEIKKNSLKKDKHVALKVQFDTSDMRGNQYKSITIYSNDPVNPAQIINIRGKVEK